MQRVKRATAVAVLPAAPDGGTPGFFAAPNPLGGVPATQPGYEWYNAIQEELMAVIEAQGLGGSSTDNTLLRQAILAMIVGAQKAVTISNALFEASVADGEVVRWDAGNARFDEAISDGTANNLAVGIADVTNSRVYLYGECPLFSGLTPGARYYLDGSTLGGITATAPSDAVMVGIAKSATVLWVDVDAGSGRIRLTDNIALHVATTGADSNSGFSVGTAFRTLQHAINTIHEGYDLNGYTVTIQVADGTYNSEAGTQLVAVRGPFTGALDAGSVIIQGNSGTPANVVLAATSNCIDVRGGAKLMLAGCKVQNATSGSALFTSGGGSEIKFSNLVFGSATAGNSHLEATSGGAISALGNYSISAGGGSHFLATAGGVIIVVGVTVTVSGTPAFSVAFASAQSGAQMSLASTTYSGSATGTRYSVTTNAVINTNGGGANYLPGNSAGSAPSGQYA